MVWNWIEIKKLSKEARKMAAELEMFDYQLPEIKLDPDYRSSRYDARTNTIYIEQYTNKDKMKILAHEMRHWYQYQNGYLANVDYMHLGPKLTAYRGYWKGRLINQIIASVDDYQSLPWEADANQFADEWMNK